MKPLHQEPRIQASSLCPIIKAKTPLIVFFGSLFFAGASLAEPRTFTNKEGKTMTAELIQVDGENAILKLANASRVKVPLASLSETDQQFVKSWWEENKNNVTEMDLRLEIKKNTRRISSADSGNPNDQVKEAIDMTRFSCGLKSYTPRDLSDISVTYTIYKRISTRGEEGTNITVETTDGSATVASISGNGSAAFETTEVACKDTASKKGGKDPKKAKSSSRRETVTGVVVKLSANGKEFLEKSYPENLIDKLKEEEEREANK